MIVSFILILSITKLSIFILYSLTNLLLFIISLQIAAKPNAKAFGSGLNLKIQDF